MQSGSDENREGESASPASLRRGDREPAHTAGAVKEQGAVLFALHNDLCQHQKSVDQAFRSLDRACCALAAHVVAPPSDTLNPAPQQEAPTGTTAQRFAQLLRQVEALHEFLFTNLYVHQRECALQLLLGVERAVVEADPATGAGSLPHQSSEWGTTLVDTAGGQGAEQHTREQRTAAAAVAGRGELRLQIAQLRHRLSSTTPFLRDSRRSLPAVDGGTRPSSTLDGGTTLSPPTVTAPSPDAASEAAASASPRSLARSTPPAESAESSTPPRISAAVSPRGSMRRQRQQRQQQLRCFAVSSAFFSLFGKEGRRSLAAVCATIQRRLCLHAVVLSGAADAALAPEAEVLLATQLGCVFLVVPQGCRRLYPVADSLLIVGDGDVPTYDRSKAEARSDRERPSSSLAAQRSPVQTVSRSGSEEDNEDEDGWREGDDGALRPAPATSSLEELFRTLEADLPRDAADLAAPWYPASTPLVRERSSAEDDDDGGDRDGAVDSLNVVMPSSSDAVVGRAALRRHGGAAQTQQRRKRPRVFTAANGVSSLSAASGHSVQAAALGNASGVSASAPDTLLGPFRSFTETAVHPVSMEGAMGEEADHDSLTPPPPVGSESQHIGITQHGPLAPFSTSPASSAATTALPAATAENDSVRNLSSGGATRGPSQPPAVSAAPSSEHPVFQISNSVKYLKPQLMEAIEQLGGRVDLSSGYSTACRFLVVAEGITERTEKYLGACAAAAYIVPPRYVFDSQRRGYWLTSRVQDYNMSPQRTLPSQPQPPPIFRSWRVVLITCRSAAARGVRAALLAGGCVEATAFVVDLTAEAPISAAARTREFDASAAVDGVVEGVCPTSVIAATTLAAATHILVECSNVTAQGFFQLPDWVPTCVRRPEYARRIFTLELLYFCLCAHPERVFDAAGMLSDAEALTPACRIEPT